MAEACGTYGRQEVYIQGFDGDTRLKENIWKTSVDGTIILKRISKKCEERAWS